jgi:hypothetical protein
MITALALMSFMFAQFVIAEHSAVHADHECSQEIASLDDHHDIAGVQHQHKNSEHENSEHKNGEHQNGEHNHLCPECLFAKSIQTALNQVPETFSIYIEVERLFVSRKLYRVVERYYQANSPRAPPTPFLV